MQKELVVGVDIGGTKVAVALCDYSGKIICKKKIDTLAFQGADRVVQRIINTIKHVINEAGVSVSSVSGIGIGSPGPVNIKEGRIVYVASVGWRDIPIRDMIYDEFKIYTCFENDANAAAYSEAEIGAGSGKNHVVYITVSTGIGCGIVINREIYHGRHDSAGEFGHICIEYEGRECTCGNMGCLQAYASGTSIAEIARENLLKYKDTIIPEIAKESGIDLDGTIIEKAARMNDKLALEIWMQMGQKLGQGISILMQLLDPDIVVIGGGVTKAWDLFYYTMLDTVRKNTYKLFNNDITIVPAMLGEDAGVLGAALLAVKGIKNKCNTALF